MRMCILALRDDCGLTNLLYHLVGGLGVAIAITFVKFYKDFSKFDQVGAVWLVCTAVCDVTIATSLTWYLVSTFLLHIYGVSVVKSGFFRGSTKRASHRPTMY